jgi:hypothetical protein
VAWWLERQSVAVRFVVGLLTIRPIVWLAFSYEGGGDTGDVNGAYVAPASTSPTEAANR